VAILEYGIKKVERISKNFYFGFLKRRQCAVVREIIIIMFNFRVVYVSRI